MIRTRKQIETLNSELVNACQAALNHLKDQATPDNAELRTQLSTVLTKSKTNPKYWALIDRPAAAIADPFAKVGAR